MNKAVIAISVLAGAVLAYGVSKTASTLKALEYGFNKIKLNSKRTKLYNLGLDLDLLIKNPSNADLKFKKFVGKLYYNDKELSNINATPPNPILLPQGKTVQLPILLDLSTFTVGLTLVEALTSGKQIPLKIVGTIYADNLQLPVNQILNAE